MSTDVSRWQGADRGVIARAARAELARRSFASFVRQAWHVLEPNGRPFIPNVGTDAIIEHLQAVGDGRITRLLIAISPGFGKSTLASVAFPAWMWARNPSWRTICASHAHLLAVQLAGRFRRVVESDWYRDAFGVALSGERTDALETTAAGRRYSAGVGGALTGFRADAAIVDDSLNAVDAHSDRVIASTNEWFDAALSTRLDRGESAPIVVIQQCLAEGDLIGHLRARGGWECLVLPAEFELAHRCSTSIWTDPRTVEGEPLAPALQTPEYLAQQRVTLGPYGYAAQFQQRPAPLEGGDIKRAWWRFFRLDEDGPVLQARPRGCTEEPSIVLGRKSDGVTLDLDWLDISVDATFGSLSPTADSVGLQLIGGKGQRRFVLEDGTRPMTFADTEAAVKSWIARTGARRVLIEKKANGAAIIERLQAAMAVGDLRDTRGRAILVQIAPIDPEGGKPARAAAMTPAIAAGLVHLLDGASWVGAFVDEHALFPNGAHDDRVDALSQCLNHHADTALDRARKLAQLGTMLAGHQF